MRNVRSLYVFFALVFVQANAAVPSKPGEFTNYVQALFEKQLPGYTFEQPEPLALKGAGPNGKTVRADGVRPSFAVFAGAAPHG